MIIERKRVAAKRMDNCHDGRGVLWCAELLADYGRQDGGFKFIHENHLEPGASIGEHRHERDEELYLILGGHGQMSVDGVGHEVGPGDACLTRRGHSHGLTNGPEGPMHFLVINANA